MNATKGKRPDLTPAQVVAATIAGIPIVSNLLAAFNVITVSGLQQEALSDTVTWGGVVAGLLIGGDVALRSARNRADSKVETAALTANSEPPDKKLAVRGQMVTGQMATMAGQPGEAAPLPTAPVDFDEPFDINEIEDDDADDPAVHEIPLDELPADEDEAPPPEVDIQTIVDDLPPRRRSPGRLDPGAQA